MPEPTTTALLTASMAGVQKIAASITTYLTNAADEHIKLKKAEKLLRRITDRIIEIRKVKTILDLENEVDLGDFYTPQHVLFGDKRFLVATIDALPYQGNIVFTGVAGQGKSVFFRYLAARVPEDGKTLPLFIELRRLAHQNSLNDLIENELDVLGFSSTSLVFETLAEAGRIVLFLDAFDEIPVDKRSRFVANIEDICRKHRKLRVLITSRPNNGIESSPYFRVMAVDNLIKGEYHEIIRRIAGSQSNANAIIAGITQENCRIKNLLTTPLMVTLLVLRYKIDASIPDNEEAFYGDLFDLLARRHDKTKAGFERSRRTDATEPKLERIFSGVCFFSRMQEDVELSREQLATYAENSARFQSLKIDAENATLDVVDVTCLLLEEAGVFQFPHRTIQEFFAAKFLKNQPDEIRRKFYRKVIDNWESWHQILRFLEILDVYQFHKQFVLPNARKWLVGDLGGDPSSLKSRAKREKALERIFSDAMIIVFRTTGGNGEQNIHVLPHSIYGPGNQFFLMRKLVIANDITSYLHAILSQAVSVDDLVPIADRIQDDPAAKILHIKLGKLASDGRFPDLLRILEDAIEKCVDQFAKIHDDLIEVDSLGDVFN